MIYGIQRDSSGNVLRCSCWSSLPAAANVDSESAVSPILPDGYVECSAEDYRAAVAAFQGTPLSLQAGAALAAARQQAEPSPEFSSYMSALQAIADGSHKPIGGLPTRPAS